MATAYAANTVIDANADEQRLIDDAHDAMSALKRTYDHWMTLGTALLMLDEKAAGMGGRWTFMDLRDQAGLGDDKIRKEVVSKLLKVMRSRVAVEAWRASLTEKQRFEWASPDALIKHCPHFKLERAKAKAAAPAKPSPYAKLQETNLALQDELHQIKRQLAVETHELTTVRDDIVDGTDLTVARRTCITAMPTADVEQQAAELVALLSDVSARLGRTDVKVEDIGSALCRLLGGRGHYDLEQAIYNITTPDDDEPTPERPTPSKAKKPRTIKVDMATETTTISVPRYTVKPSKAKPKADKKLKPGQSTESLWEAAARLDNEEMAAQAAELGYEWTPEQAAAHAATIVALTPPEYRGKEPDAQADYPDLPEFLDRRERPAADAPKLAWEIDGPTSCVAVVGRGRARRTYRVDDVVDGVGFVARVYRDDGNVDELGGADTAEAAMALCGQHHAAAH